MGYCLETVKSTAKIKEENYNDALKWIKRNLAKVLRFDGFDYRYVEEVKQKLKQANNLGEALSLFDTVYADENRYLYYDGYDCAWYDLFDEVLSIYGTGKIILHGEDGDVFSNEYPIIIKKKATRKCV